MWSMGFQTEQQKNITATVQEEEEKNTQLKEQNWTIM